MCLSGKHVGPLSLDSKKISEVFRFREASEATSQGHPPSAASVVVAEIAVVVTSSLSLL